jgi:SAM-dependent methyltransferase
VSQSYHTTRLTEDPRRDVLWRTLCESYFARFVAPGDCALDLGCGYGGFINHIRAARRIAVDAWPGFLDHLAPGVKGVVGPVHDLGFLEDGSVDFAFASNVFEHVTQEELAQCLRSLKPKLSAKGTINILQPNYRYCSAEYFDDYTHKSIYSHVSLADFLRVQGYEVLDVQRRFMPLSVKSRLPVSPALIRLYLWSPVKPLGKQMLVRARPLQA